MSFCLSSLAATASTSDCRKETALSVCTQSLPLVSVSTIGDPVDVVRAHAQEAERLGAAEDVAGVGAGAGLDRGGVQRHRAVGIAG